MYPLYAVRFSIVCANSSSQRTFFQLVDLVKEWVGVSYESKFGYQLTFGDANARHTPLPLHSLNVGLRHVGEISTWTLDWKYPHDTEPNVFWSVLVEIAKFHNDIEFSLNLAFDWANEEHTITHHQLHRLPFGRPRIVQEISDKFQCELGGRRITTSTTYLPRQAVPDFVSNVLLSRERRLPVVLYSPDSVTLRPVWSPDRAARNLVGLAEVFVLTDKWATYALTDVVGREYSCYQGAVRLYYPQFYLGADFAQCPVYLRDNLVFFQSENAFANGLLRRLAFTSSSRFSAGSTTQLAHEYIKEFDERQDQAKDARIAELELKLSTAYANIDALSRGQKEELREQEPSTSGIPDEEPTTKFKTVIEAVEWAEDEFGETLVFTKEAYTSAKASPFQQPTKVYHALEAIHDVCKERQKAKRTRASLGAIELLFEAKGFEYEPHVSQTALGKHPDEYFVAYEGNNVPIHAHLKLGRGNADTCLRVYFYWDAEKDIYVIGHVGKHKPGAN